MGKKSVFPPPNPPPSVLNEARLWPLVYRMSSFALERQSQNFKGYPGAKKTGGVQQASDEVRKITQGIKMFL